MRKYCRICWNTKFWREPTGEATKIETANSYVKRNGFGHEEWLFNFEWLLSAGNGGPKYKYGFLQPMGKFRKKYVGNIFDLLLYTVPPDKTRVAIAEIRQAYIPDLEELTSALREMRQQGWVKDMESDLESLKISPEMLSGSPEEIINVRFEPRNVAFFDPRLLLPPENKTYRLNRYHPLDWDDELPQVFPPARSGNLRSEADRYKAAVEATTYSPRHVKLQNALLNYLEKEYGKQAVKYESSFVDLILEQHEEVTFFEIKISPTAKGCIREAFGQLLEYSSYPNGNRAQKLVVVGDGYPNHNDISYLRYLRAEYGIPIYYRRWAWESRELESEV